jgi:hypothetical protein
MSRQKHDISANDFVDPLIRVLGTMTNYTANVAVPMRTTFQPIMDIMEIESLTSYGYQDPGTNKRPFVARWIGFAFRGSRVPAEDGSGPALTVGLGRGKWGLTEAGVAAAQTLNGLPVMPWIGSHATTEGLAHDKPASDPLDAAVQHVSAFPSFQALCDDIVNNDYVPTLRPDTAEHHEPKWNRDIQAVRVALAARNLPMYPTFTAVGLVDNAPVKLNPLGRGRQLAVAQVNDVVYHTDPYIVSLAAQQTSCYGAFSPKSKACDGCSLRGSCLQVVRAHLIELANGFQRTLDKANNPEPEVVVETPKVRTRPAEWDDHNRQSHSVAAQSDTACYRCRNEIEKKEKCMWNKDHGFYHMGCQ